MSVNILQQTKLNQRTHFPTDENKKMHIMGTTSPQKQTVKILAKGFKDMIIYTFLFEAAI